MVTFNLPDLTPAPPTAGVCLCLREQSQRFLGASRPRGPTTAIFVPTAVGPVPSTPHNSLGLARPSRAHCPSGGPRCLRSACCPGRESREWGTRSPGKWGSARAQRRECAGSRGFSEAALSPSAPGTTPGGAASPRNCSPGKRQSVTATRDGALTEQRDPGSVPLRSAATPGRTTLGRTTPEAESRALPSSSQWGPSGGRAGRSGNRTGGQVGAGVR